MKDELKNSLNKVFEHEKLGQPSFIEPRRKRKLLPVLLTACLLLGVAVGTYTLLQGNITGTTTSSKSDRATLDHLQDEFIGNHVAVGEINQAILYDFDLSRLELKTKEEPYGMIIHAEKPIPQGMKLKHAFYMFSLIQNVEYIVYKTPDGPTNMDRTTLEGTYNIDFSTIKGDEAILTAYYTAIATTLPQIQTSREDAYKYLFKALNSAQTMSDFTTSVAPDYAFTMDEEQYVLWNAKSEIYIVNIKNPNTATVVYAETYDELVQFLSMDHLLVTGPIMEITEQQLLVSTGNDQDISYLVTVDDAKAYDVGDSISVWATMTTMSIPAQTTATKIQKIYQ